MRMILPCIFLLIATSVFSFQRQAGAPGDLQAVTLIDGSQSIQMKYVIASRRSHTGIASEKQYFVFAGQRAMVRTSNKTPVFQFETDPTFDEPVVLFKLDTQPDKREIRVAKGMGDLAEVSIPRDHIVSTTMEEIGDGQNSMKRYRLKPTGALHRGEYCLGRNSYTCFDFGVDK